MKEIGIVTLLSVVAVAAAPHARSEKVTVFVSEKSVQALGACLAGAHGDNGGGLILSDRGSRREVQLRNAAVDGPEAQAVKRCI